MSVPVQWGHKLYPKSVNNCAQVRVTEDLTVTQIRGFYFSYNGVPEELNSARHSNELGGGPPALDGNMAANTWVSA